jgi:hypothetical protein
MSLAIAPGPICVKLTQTIEDAMDVTQLSGPYLWKLYEQRRRQRHKVAEEVKRRIAPFRGEIEHVASHFDDKPRYGAGLLNIPSPRRRIRWFLEQHVVLHGRMPEGRLRVDFTSHGCSWSESTFDFDELRRRKE